MDRMGERMRENLALSREKSAMAKNDERTLEEKTRQLTQYAERSMMEKNDERRLEYHMQRLMADADRESRELRAYSRLHGRTTHPNAIDCPPNPGKPQKA